MSEGRAEMVALGLAWMVLLIAKCIELILFLVGLLLALSQGGAADAPGANPLHLEEAQVRALAQRYDDWDVETMVEIAWWESRYQFDAVNSTGHACGWQISPLHGYTGLELDPYKCVEAAHDVWLKQGYGAWQVYPEMRN